MKTNNPQEIAITLANWDRLIAMADKINKRFNRGRITVGHLVVLDKAKNEWIETYNIFGIYIETHSLLQEQTKNGFASISKFGDAVAYLNGLEKSFEKDGVININDVLIGEVSKLEDNYIPLDVLIEFLNNREPTGSIDDAMEPIEKLYPNEPDEKFLNALRRIAISKDKTKIPDNATISTNIEEIKNLLNKCLGGQTKTGGLKELIDKHKVNHDKGLVR